MKLLDGKALRDRILAEIADEVKAMDAPPGLTVVQVGEDPASSVYIRNKLRACKKTGIRSGHVHLPEDTTQETLNGEIRRLSEDDSVHGILLQLPLPGHLDDVEATRQLDPAKDVDGFLPENLGRLMAGLPGPRPCTPAGILELVRESGISPSGKEVVVLGRSLIVGKPAGMLFLLKGQWGDATVTYCHSRTRDLPAVCRRADILVAAIGRPRFVTSDMISEGAVVIDVGINSIEDPTHPKGRRLVGDCDFDAMKDKVAAITPVPGGVGPMTIAMLMRNTLDAARARQGGKA